MAVWAKIMTSLRDHKKAKRAGDRAMWLYVCMILFSKERDTYGRVSVDELNTLNAQRGKFALAKRLVDCELLAEIDDGWEIIGYVEKQGETAAISDVRAKKREQKRKERAAKSSNVASDTLGHVANLEQIRAEQIRADIDISLDEPTTSSAGFPF